MTRNSGRANNPSIPLKSMALVPPLSGGMTIQNFARNPVFVNKRLSAACYRTQTLASNLAKSRRAFSQRLRRLREWAETALPDSAMKTHTLDLCDKRAQFSRSYDYHYAHRTSNMVDRLMKFLDRACFNGQYFHGTVESAESRVRALALLWNFCPSSPGTVKKYHGQECPAQW